MSSTASRYHHPESTALVGGRYLTINHRLDQYLPLSRDGLDTWLSDEHFPSQHRGSEPVRIEYFSCPVHFTGDDIYRETADARKRPAYADELLSIGTDLYRQPFLAIVALDLRVPDPDQPETFVVPFIATNRRRSKLYAGMTRLLLNEALDLGTVLPTSVANPSGSDVAFAFVWEEA
jgi:hypothetical protein